MQIRRGVILYNPSSGGEPTDTTELAGAFPAAKLVEMDPERLEDQVAEVVALEPDFVGVAGGDGTIRSVAELLLEAGSPPPLLPVPAGTLNHFARAIGIETIDDAGAAAGGVEAVVDVGEVDGRVFLNNSSVGAYARSVETRERLEKRMPKRVARWIATWRELTSGEPFTASLGGRSYRVWLVFVGNGRYGVELADARNRESLADGLLDVRVVRADIRLARLRLLGAIVLGQVARSRVLVRRAVEDIEIGLDQSPTPVALDGEVETLSGPLAYRCHPCRLTVLVPRTAPA